MTIDVLSKFAWVFPLKDKTKKKEKGLSEWALKMKKKKNQRPYTLIKQEKDNATLCF